MDGFTQADWAQLLHLIRERKVVPVVGRELSVIDAENATLPLEAYLASQLRKLPELDPTLSLQDPFFLEYLASSREHCQLYANIYNLAHGVTRKVPEPITQLAQITDFPLYISTTFDDFLPRALDHTRWTASDALRRNVFRYSPHDPTPDIAVAQMAAADPVVYQLFGGLTPCQGDYVVTQEDVLEFLHQFQAQRPKHLMHALKDSHLLMIGCGFPDWLSRFFLRTIKNEPLLESRRKFKAFADDSTKDQAQLMDFLRQCNTRVFSGGVAFVQELHDRWTKEHEHRAQFAPSPAPRRTEPTENLSAATVFLSYASEDRDQARALKEALESWDLKVWFDRDDIAEAQDWQQSIRSGIEKCCVFVACTSPTTERGEAREFRTEWKMAVHKAERNFGTSRRYIWPVWIGEQSEVPKQVPAEFTARQIIHAPGGVPTDDFVLELISEIRAGLAQEVAAA